MMILTEQQKSAVNATVHWFKNDRKQQQIFRIYGYAGVGKSTIVQHIIGELGVRAVFGTVTGKAARVLTQKGVPAQTIHKMIYVYQPPQNAEIKKLEDKIELLNEFGDDDGELSNLRRQLLELQKPVFILNPEAPVVNVDLIVLDECSMIDDQLANDLLSFGKPLLILGDPGQLPPIQRTSGGFSDAAPDVFLDEIHRQALESPIIRLATLARKGEPIPFGEFSDTVCKFSKKEVPLDHLSVFGQVICGYNKTRISINNAIRKKLGFTSDLPVGPEEKVIITANRHIFGLLNGMMAELSSVTKKDEYRFYADIKIPDEDNSNIGTRPCYSGHFLNHKDFIKTRVDDEWRVRRASIEADFGYAITAHKAQGSGWDSVAIYDDGWNLDGHRARWLYTAITRSERCLWIIA